MSNLEPKLPDMSSKHTKSPNMEWHMGTMWVKGIPEPIMGLEDFKLAWSDPSKVVVFDVYCWDLKERCNCKETDCKGFLTKALQQKNKRIWIKTHVMHVRPKCKAIHRYPDFIPFGYAFAPDKRFDDSSMKLMKDLNKQCTKAKRLVREWIHENADLIQSNSSNNNPNTIRSNESSNTSIHLDLPRLSSFGSVSSRSTWSPNVRNNNNSGSKSLSLNNSKRNDNTFGRFECSQNNGNNNNNASKSVSLNKSKTNDYSFGRFEWSQNITNNNNNASKTISLSQSNKNDKSFGGLESSANIANNKNNGSKSVSLNKSSRNDNSFGVFASSANIANNNNNGSKSVSLNKSSRNDNSFGRFEWAQNITNNNNNGSRSSRNDNSFGGFEWAQNITNNKNNGSKTVSLSQSTQKDNSFGGFEWSQNIANNNNNDNISFDLETNTNPYARYGMDSLGCEIESNSHTNEISENMTTIAAQVKLNQHKKRKTITEIDYNRLEESATTSSIFEINLDKKRKKPLKKRNKKPVIPPKGVRIKLTNKKKESDNESLTKDNDVEMNENVISSNNNNQNTEENLAVSFAALQKSQKKKATGEQTLRRKNVANAVVSKNDLKNRLELVNSSTKRTAQYSGNATHQKQLEETLKNPLNANQIQTNFMNIAASGGGSGIAAFINNSMAMIDPAKVSKAEYQMQIAHLQEMTDWIIIQLFMQWFFNANNTSQCVSAGKEAIKILKQSNALYAHEFINDKLQDSNYKYKNAKDTQAWNFFNLLKVYLLFSSNKTSKDAYCFLEGLRGIIDNSEEAENFVPILDLLETAMKELPHRLFKFVDIDELKELEINETNSQDMNANEMDQNAMNESESHVMETYENEMNANDTYENEMDDLYEEVFMTPAENRRQQQTVILSDNESQEENDKNEIDSN